jgi:hypothetical protein
MLILHTRIQQTPALIVTAWCAAHAILECVRESIEKRSQVENVTVFCCLSIFATASFSQNDLLQVKH